MMTKTNKCGSGCTRGARTLHPPPPLHLYGAMKVRDEARLSSREASSKSQSGRRRPQSSCLSTIRRSVSVMCCDKSTPPPQPMVSVRDPAPHRTGGGNMAKKKYENAQEELRHSCQGTYAQADVSPPCRQDQVQRINLLLFSV